MGYDNGNNVTKIVTNGVKVLKILNLDLLRIGYYKNI